MRTLLLFFYVVTLSACGGSGGSGASASGAPYYVGDWTTTNQDQCIVTSPAVANTILFDIKADKSISMFDQSINLPSPHPLTFDGDYIYFTMYAWQWERLDDTHARLHFSPTCSSDYTKTP